MGKFPKLRRPICLRVVCTYFELISNEIIIRLCQLTNTVLNRIDTGEGMNKQAISGLRQTLSKPRILKSNETTRVEKNYSDKKYVYSCQYCILRFTQNSHFFRHMTTNHKMQQKQATYQCNDCQIVFTKKSNLDLHYQTHHQIKSKLRCDSCAVRFKSRYCLKRHLKLKQLMQENSCSKCQKKFMTKELLSKHMSNKHIFKNVTFQCDLCTLKFKVKRSLQSHTNRVHRKL